MSTVSDAAQSGVDAGRNEDIIPGPSEQGGSRKQTPEAGGYSGGKKAIGDKLMELGQLFHKPDLDYQSKISNGQIELLERTNQLGKEIPQYFSDNAARQDEAAKKLDLTLTEIKQSVADLAQQSQNHERQAQANHVQTVKIREHHHKEALARRERSDREAKRRSEESMRQRDQAHSELMAKMGRLNDGITQLLQRSQAAERPADPRRADATGRKA